MADLETFREETRRWLQANAPASMYQPFKAPDELCWGGRKMQCSAEAKRWLDVMAERGWTAPAWPKEYGGGAGADADPERRSR